MFDSFDGLSVTFSESFLSLCLLSFLLWNFYFLSTSGSSQELFPLLFKAPCQRYTQRDMGLLGGGGGGGGGGEPAPPLSQPVMMSVSEFFMLI